MDRKTIIESNVDVTSELILTARRALAIALPRIEPMRQEKLFCSVSLALEQCEYAIHLIERSKSMAREVIPIIMKALPMVRHVDRARDGKMLAAEGREVEEVESPMICGKASEFFEGSTCYAQQGHTGNCIFR